MRKTDFIHIKCLYALSAFLFFSIFGFSSYAYPSKGRILNWQMDVPDGWVGGNVEEIRDYIKRSDNANLKTILSTLVRTASEIEAVYIQLHDAYDASKNRGGFTSRTLTNLTVAFLRNKPNDKSFSSSSTYNKEFFEAYRRVLSFDAPSGAQVSYISDHIYQAADRNVYTGVYKLSASGLGTIYNIVAFMPLENLGVLFFKLKTDFTRKMERQIEMRRMIESLEFY